MGKGYHDTFFWNTFDRIAAVVDRKWGWDKLPVPLGILVLIGNRDVLRKRNLFDTTSQPAVNTPPVEDYSSSVLTRRMPDGTYNDLRVPPMGMAGLTVRAQRPDRPDVPRPRPAEPQPPRGQPGRDDARRVHPGHVVQRTGVELAAVHDPRLVQPREEPDGGPDRDPAQAG